MSILSSYDALRQNPDCYETSLTRPVTQSPYIYDAIIERGQFSTLQSNSEVFEIDLSRTTVDSDSWEDLSEDPDVGENYGPEHDGKIIPTIL